MTRDEFLTAFKPKKIKLTPPLLLKRYLRCVELHNEWKATKAKAERMEKKYRRKLAYYHRRGIGGGKIK